MTEPTPDWALVAKAIDGEMRTRGMTKQGLIDASGVSFKTISKVLDGEPLTRRDIKRDIAEAMGWTADGLDRIAAGEDPATIPRLVLGVGIGASTTGGHGEGTVERGPIQLSASGVDLNELAEKDPEAYEAIMVQARIALDRARERRLDR